MNLLIIGCGGVASYLIPVLARTFKTGTIHIFDGDNLEKRNLDRQAFEEKYIGENKAKALVSTIQERTDRDPESLKSYTRYFTGDHDVPEDSYLDAIIVVADNHEARKFGLEAADRIGVPCIIGANELFDSEAYIYLPAWKDTPNDPRIKHPQIVTDTTGSPLHCQEEQEASPQLAVANFACAGKIATMLWRWLVEEKKKNKIMLHHENIYDVIVALPDPVA